MIMFEEKNASHAKTSAAGSRNGRGTSDIVRRRLDSTIGPEPKDSTVAEVMNPTNFCQPGNGAKITRPATKVTTTLTHGTPRLLILARDSGAFLFRAIA
jgi:hypothetical protein